MKEDLEPDVCVVGAGPIGCYLASALAKNRIKTLVIEEHQEVGKPLQCAGLVSENIFKVVDLPKELIKTRIKGAKFIFPNGKAITFKGKALVLDRINFDKHLYEAAKSNGVEFLLNESFETFSLNKGVDVKTNKRMLKSKIIVGADGPRSLVGKRMGITPQLGVALQVRAKIKRDPTLVELYFGEEVCPNFFAWIVPENENVSRVGLGTLRDVPTYMDRFLKRLKIKEIIDRQAGVIPIDYLKKTSSERALLVGDAASQVKATSGGGITTGLLCAKEAVNAVRLAFKKNDFSESFFENEYDSKWQKEIGKDLFKAYNIRMIMNELSDDEFNTIYKLAQDENLVAELEKKVDLERYSNFIPELARNPKIMLTLMNFALRKPKILKYAMHLI